MMDKVVWSQGPFISFSRKTSQFVCFFTDEGRTKAKQKRKERMLRNDKNRKLDRKVDQKTESVWD